MRVLLSRRVVKVSAEDRLSDVSHQIEEARASHCVVLEKPRGEFLGIVRVRDAAMRPTNRIFADLLSAVPTFRIAKNLPSTTVAQLVGQENLEDAVVLSNSGKFVGLITRESMCDFRLKESSCLQTTPETRGTDRDRQIARLSRKVHRQAAALKEAIAQLEEFSYAVSHDLRTPLRAIRGYAIALQDDYGPRLDEPANEYVRRIILASYRLDRLALGLLSYNQVAASDVTLQPIDLDKIVADAVAEKIRHFPRADIRVQGPLNAVKGAPSLLGDCVAQLLDNALKFTVKDRPVVVRISTERVGKEIKLWVEDNGLGLRPANRRRIFQLFETVHGEGNFPGIGVGLAIVRRAMEKMGGTVGVESAAGGGSRFWLRLPSRDK